MSRWGCGFEALEILLAILLLAAFLSGVSTVVYLILPPPHRDLLVIGTDAGDTSGDTVHPDSLLLVGIDPGLLRVSVLSLPTDVALQVPGNGMQPIREMDSQNVAMLTDALAHNLGVHLDGYVRIDYAAFSDLIDAVGGIKVDVDRVIEDNAFPADDGQTIRVRFESGVQTMDGKRALIYVRIRSDDDFQRATRQQQVMAALAQKLSNPTYWYALVGVLDEWDTNLSLWEIAMLAPPFIVSHGRFETLTIAAKDTQQDAAGQNLLNENQLLPWLQGRFRLTK